jgi:hypothetical protein
LNHTRTLDPHISRSHTLALSLLTFLRSYALTSSLEPLKDPIIDIIKHSSNHYRNKDRNDHKAIIPPWDARRFDQIGYKGNDQDHQDHAGENEGQIGSHIFIPKPDPGIDDCLDKGDYSEIGVRFAFLAGFHTDIELFTGTIY